MNRNLLKLIVACGAACFIACTAPQKAETEKWSERMARSEMKRFPEPWMIEKAKVPRWGYTHGLVVKSMLEEWKHTGDSTYYEYAKIYADSLIDTDVNGGKILFDLYAQSGDERYKIAMDTLRKQMAEQPRTSEGGFWHKLRYPHQMWLDGIFMASPYLVQYGLIQIDHMKTISTITVGRIISTCYCNKMIRTRSHIKCTLINTGSHVALS